MSISDLTLKQRIGAISGVAVSAWVWFMPKIEGLPDAGQKAFAISLFIIIFWVTEPIRVELTSIIAMLLFTLTGTVEPSVSFSGFVSSVLWLSFSGLVIGAGVLHSGLAERLSLFVTRAFGRSYPSALVGTGLMGILLGLVMPIGIGRVAVMTPIAIGLGRAFGFKPYSRGMAGLVLAGLASTTFPMMSVLTATIPVITVAGLLETILGRQILWAEWAGMFMPTVLPINWMLILGALLAWTRFGGATALNPRLKQEAGMRRITHSEKKMLVYLVLALTLWATDFLHKVNPAWIGLAVAAVMVLPGVGVLSYDDFASKVSFLTLFYIAAALSIGRVLSDTGFAGWASQVIFSSIRLEGADPWSQAYIITGLTAAIGLVVPGPSQPAFVTPLLADYASASGMDAFRLILKEVLAFQVIFFPYQMIPVIVALGFKVIKTSQAVMLLLITSAIALLATIPLTIAYWTLIGLA